MITFLKIINRCSVSMKKKYPDITVDAEIIEIRLRHLTNQYEVMKEENDRTSVEYLTILDEFKKTNAILQNEISERKNAEAKLKKNQETKQK